MSPPATADRTENRTSVASADWGVLMQRPYMQIEVERQGGVFCVRIIDHRLPVDALEDLGAELGRLIDEEGCRKMVLNLGPGDLDCLYSLFLAKLVSLQRRLENAGGQLAIAQASDNTREVFRVTALEKFFKFYPDQASAVNALS